MKCYRVSRDLTSNTTHLTRHQMRFLKDQNEMLRDRVAELKRDLAVALAQVKDLKSEVIDLDVALRKKRGELESEEEEMEEEDEFSGFSESEGEEKEREEDGGEGGR